jgi:hypothetical protein
MEQNKTSLRKKILQNNIKSEIKVLSEYSDSVTINDKETIEH